MRTVCVLLGLLVPLAACKGKPTDDRPIDDVDRDQLLREQQRVAKGETVGELLRSPTVVVGPQDVTINGQRVASGSDVDPGVLRRVEPVFTWAKGLREHWKTIHPAQAFEPRIDVTLPEDLTLPAGASVLATLAFAGYPRAMTVRSGGASVVIDFAVPGPPSLPDGGGAAPETTLQVCKPPGWQARSATAPRGWDDAHDPLAAAVQFGLIGPTARQDTTRWQPVSEITVATVASDACQGECSHVVIEASGPTTFHDAMPLLAAATRVPKDHAVAFTATCANADGGREAGAPKPRAALRAGRVTVSGHLSPDDVERVVRARYNRFEGCYESTAAAKPRLQGRVVVAFSIAADGTVASAMDGGSDLPDPSVVQCIVRAFSSLVFPKPESGTVAVTYPLMLSPAE